MAENILSLDLEGVLVTSAEVILNPQRYQQRADWLVRPRTGYDTFLQEASGIFNTIYMNTLVSKQRTDSVMTKLQFHAYEYWNSPTENKIKGLCSLAENHTIFHVEDGIPKNEEALARQHGIHYIEVLPYNQYRQNDTELETVLKQIKTIL